MEGFPAALENEGKNTDLEAHQNILIEKFDLLHRIG